ncbi:MAG TPA: DNA repair protein [Roseiflexaceae bacterium]|nr:DNA repair protein [Roseiflexaceae bacterium]
MHAAHATERLLNGQTLRERLLALYDSLYAHFGHEPHWWPIVTDTPQFEMLVGAVLVQQTRWETVEAAVVRLRDAGLLTPTALASADTATLAALIRPCAFHTQKAPGLQAIARHLLARHGGEMAALLAQERVPLRAELLSLPRIGQETADTIMLYAGGHAVFIVDAYARRLLGRLGIAPGFDFARARYDDVQALVEQAVGNQEPEPMSDESLPFPPFIVPRSSLYRFYWNFHALIIEECIHHCLATRPRQDQPGARRTFVDPRKCAEHCLTCQGCPVRDMCASYQAPAFSAARS